MNQQLIVDGFCTKKESYDFESKRCEKKLPKNFWETYSSFANTFGGDIVLGFTELPDGRLKLTGVADPDKILKELWDLLHDRKKVSANILMEDDVCVCESGGLKYIVVHVPRASRDKRPVFINNDLNGGTFRRSNNGDYHCSISEIMEMGRDASDSNIDQRIIDGSSLDDICMDTVNRYRNSIRSLNSEHPLLREDTDEFLRLIGAAVVSDGGTSLTQAGLVMFGKGHRISWFIPQYHLEYNVCGESGEWIDRFTSDTGLWSGNVFDFYLDVSNRLFHSNSHPFVLKNGIRMDSTDLIAAQREMLLNGLVHADYLGAGGISVNFYGKSISVTNPGCFRIPLDKAMSGGYSDARNPIMMRMFSLTGSVERAGSGIHRIICACKAAGFGLPEIEEEVNPALVKFTIGFDDSRKSLDDVIIGIMNERPDVTIDEIVVTTGVSRSTVSRKIEGLKKEGKIVREGGKRGFWSVLL